MIRMNQTDYKKKVYSDSIKSKLIDKDQQTIIKRLNEKEIYEFTIVTRLNGRCGMIIDLRSSKKVLVRGDFSDLMMSGMVLMNEERLIYGEEDNVIGIQLMTFSQMFSDMFQLLISEMTEYLHLQEDEKQNLAVISKEYDVYMVQRINEISQIMDNHEYYYNFIEVLENRSKSLYEINV